MFVIHFGQGVQRDLLLRRQANGEAKLIRRPPHHTITHVSGRNTSQFDGSFIWGSSLLGYYSFCGSTTLVRERVASPERRRVDEWIQVVVAAAAAATCQITDHLSVLLVPRLGVTPTHTHYTVKGTATTFTPGPDY